MLALNNIQGGSMLFLQLHYYFTKNKGAAKNEVLNFISLQPLFHYGVRPLSIRADNFLLVAVINIQLS